MPALTISAWLRFDSIRSGLRKARPRRVLEIGAGQGALGAWLAPRFEYVGVEPDNRSRAVAAERLKRAGHGEILPAAPDPATGHKFDLVCAFEVLEHIEDDAAALGHWRQMLVDQGHLLISVPAHAWRFGVSDSYVGHFRRYDRAPLQELLDNAAFEVVQWHSYGAGLGHLLDSLRNRVLAGRSNTLTADDGTALSGRLFQPQSSLRVFVNYLAALPFRVLQAPLAATDIGIGYVVLARLRADQSPRKLPLT